MYKKISVQFKNEWILFHRLDTTLPTDLIADKVATAFEVVSVVDKGLDYITFTVSSEDKDSALTKKVNDFIISLFKGLTTDKFTVQVAKLTSKEEKELVAKAREEAQEDSGLKSLLSSFTKSDAKVVKDEEPAPVEEKTAEAPAEEKSDISSLFAKMTKKKEQAQQEQAEKERKNAEEVMAEINALAGFEDFKALCNELYKVAPTIVKNKTLDTLFFQSYLIAINSGCGLTLCLNLLAKLFNALGVCPITADDVIEKEIDIKKDANAGAQMVQQLFTYDRGGRKIVSIDISAYMAKLKSQEFKDFVKEVGNILDKAIVVFRIPYVDREIVENVREALNDTLFVKVVPIAPFTENELCEYATKRCKELGFNLTKSAHAFVKQRIAEEKSDGKFYGFKTIKKIVMELVYKKQLKNCDLKKPSYDIDENDASLLVYHYLKEDLSGYEMLDKLVGTASIKQRINEIISQIEFARSQKNVAAPCINMRFVGNPGTGKTTVARIIGKILKEKGVLSIGNFYEYAGRDFCGRYIGETAPKTSSICRDAYGSVLFIDEAYSLYRGEDNNRDFGVEALDTLIAEMENHREDFVVIMAGYTDDMEKLMKGNAGLAGRMPYLLEFPNFTRAQLCDIFVSMCQGKFEYEPELIEACRDYFNSLPDSILNSKEFSNARFVRNLFERTWAKSAIRNQLEKKDKIVLTKDDFERSCQDKEFKTIFEKKAHLGF